MLFQVTFEAIVGDGYQSDIALHNVVFTVDNHCSTYPPAAVPTVSGTTLHFLLHGKGYFNCS